MTVFEMIEAQQKGKEGTPAYMVGEQLKDICRNEPNCAQLVAADLENKDMSLEAAAGKIKAHADKLHREKKGNCVCITPDVADGIIREFYGLGKGERVPTGSGVVRVESESAMEFLNLDDFL